MHDRVTNGVEEFQKKKGFVLEGVINHSLYNKGSGICNAAVPFRDSPLRSFTLMFDAEAPETPAVLCAVGCRPPWV
ncbi:hypothetical protein Aduo_006393 [Ancylostoma duodenale]